MAVTGSRATLYDGAVLPARIKVDMADEIINVEAGYNNRETPFFTLSQTITKKREVHSSKYDCLEDTYNIRQGKIDSGAVAKNATDIPVLASFGEWLRAGSVLYAPRTGERIMVGAVTTAASLAACIRNVGAAIVGTDGQVESLGIALLVNDVLVHVSNAFPEGTISPGAISTQTEASYNYTEIEKTAVDLSQTLIHTDMYGENNDEAYQLKKAALDHKFKIERNLIFGARSIRQNAASGKAVRTTAGVLQHIKGNILDISGAAYGGALTEYVLNEWIEMLFMNDGSGVRHVLCGMRFAHACDAILRKYVRADLGASKMGTQMKAYETSNGELRIVVAKKLFEYEPTIRGTALALDMAYIRYVYLQGRDTTLRKGIKDEMNDGYDGNKSEYITEYGLDMRGWGLDNSHAASSDDFRSVHGKLTGFTTY